MTPDHYTDKSAYDEWNTGAAPAITTAPTSGKSSRFFRRNKNYSQNIISGFHRRNKKDAAASFFIFLPYFTS